VNKIKGHGAALIVRSGGNVSGVALSISIAEEFRGERKNEKE